MSVFTVSILILSFTVGCMALALCILHSSHTKATWAKLLVAFLSVLIGMMMLLATEHFSTSVLRWAGQESISRILSIVFDSIISVAVGFLLMFIPYFINLIIARPIRGRIYWPVVVTVALSYISLAVLRMVFDYEKLSLFQAIIVLANLLFCMISLWVNIRKIQSKQVRNIVLAANIVCLSLLPVFFLTQFFPSFQTASYGLYFIAFSIVLIVYFYGYFATELKREKKELKLSDLAEFHISEREFSVILLVSQGLTNKEIGENLDISVNTVNNHVANIFAKTGVRSRIDLLNLLKDRNK